MKKSTWHAMLLPICLIFLLSACATRRNNVIEEPAANAGKPIGTIVLMPIAPPKRLYTDNRGIPVLGAVSSGIANTIMDKFKSADFDSRYADYREQAGAKLTQAMLQELKRRGFSVTLAPAGFAERNKSGTINFARLPAGTTVLDVQFDVFGMYSGRMSSNYLPVIDAYIQLGTSNYRKDGYLHDAYYLYGGWANSNGDGYILSEEKYAFPNFEALMTQSDLVRESYDDGIKKLAWHLVRDLRMNFKPMTEMAHAPEAATPARVENPAPATPSERKSTRRKARRDVSARIENTEMQGQQ